MKKYYYQIIDQNNLKQSGSLFAYHREEAMHRMAQQHNLLLQLEEETWWKYPSSILQSQELFTQLDLSFMCKQLKFLLQGGIPLREVLMMMITESKQSRHSLFFSEVVNAIDAGYRFSESLDRWGKQLPHFFVQSIRAGELSGNWETIFSDLAEFFMKEHQSMQQRKQVLLYPILLLIVTGMVSNFIIITIVPNFLSLYEDGRVLPWPTRFLLVCYQSRYYLILSLLAILLILVVVLPKFLTSPKMQMKASKVTLQLPQIGSFLIKQDLARFCRTSSLLLAQGLEINQCLPVCSMLLFSPYLRERVLNISLQLDQGRGFSSSMQDISIWPAGFIKMLQLGETGNRLQETLADAATLYDLEVQNQLQTGQRMIEPLLIIGISLLVGFLAYAILLPMMDQWQGYQMI